MLYLTIPNLRGNEKCMYKLCYDLCIPCAAALRDEPMSLCVHMPLKYGTRDVVLCVDTRVGHITATIEPPCQVGRVSSFVEELEKAVTSNKSALPLHLNRLQ